MGHFRARGEPPRASMELDDRPQISPPHRASSLKASLGRYQAESRMLNGWRTAISLFRSKREVPRNRYADPNRLIPLDVILNKSDFSHRGYVGETYLPTIGQIEVTPGPWPSSFKLQASRSVPSEQSASATMGGETTSLCRNRASGQEHAGGRGGRGKRGDGMGML